MGARAEAEKFDRLLEWNGMDSMSLENGVGG